MLELPREREKEAAVLRYHLAAEERALTALARSARRLTGGRTMRPRRPVLLSRNGSIAAGPTIALSAMPAVGTGSWGKVGVGLAASQMERRGFCVQAACRCNQRNSDWHRRASGRAGSMPIESACDPGLPEGLQAGYRFRWPTPIVGGVVGSTGE